MPRTGDLTGDPGAAMWWTVEDYTATVVVQYGFRLAGYPRDVPFGNLSDIGGGGARLAHLLRLWRTGALRFEPPDGKGSAGGDARGKPPRVLKRRGRPANIRHQGKRR